MQLFTYVYPPLPYRQASFGKAETICSNIQSFEVYGVLNEDLETALCNSPRIQATFHASRYRRLNTMTQVTQGIEPQAPATRTEIR